MRSRLQARHPLREELSCAQLRGVALTRGLMEQRVDVRNEPPQGLDLVYKRFDDMQKQLATARQILRVLK